MHTVYFGHLELKCCPESLVHEYFLEAKLLQQSGDVPVCKPFYCRKSSGKIRENIRRHSERLSEVAA